MPAFSPHHTATTDVAWDGPANKVRAKSGESRNYYRKIFAWYDPTGDDGAKSTYRFIHHECSSDGSPGAANIKGCQSGCGVLNGGMGGTTIPDADRRGVWEHLATHLRDAGVEPPELKSWSDEHLERRTVTLNELRLVAPEPDQPERIIGHAAVFNQQTDIGPWFREQIAKGAFRKTIKEADVRALFNHNPDYVLGRNQAGTLGLKEDDEGLAVEIVPPDTQFANDLKTSMKRGDISQMSFGFEVIREEWDESDPHMPLRTLKEVKLWDVSVVTFPAYPQTSASVRQHIAMLRERSAEPEPMAHSVEPGEPWRIPHSIRERELQLLAMKV